MAKKKEYFKLIIKESTNNDIRSLLWSASYFDSYIAALYYTQD